LKTFLRDESGQDQVEYILATTGLALGAIAVIPNVAGQVLQCWTSILQAFNRALGLS